MLKWTAQLLLRSEKLPKGYSRRTALPTMPLTGIEANTAKAAREIAESYCDLEFPSFCVGKVVREDVKNDVR